MNTLTTLCPESSVITVGQNLSLVSPRPSWPISFLNIIISGQVNIPNRLIKNLFFSTITYLFKNLKIIYYFNKTFDKKHTCPTRKPFHPQRLPYRRQSCCQHQPMLFARPRILFYLFLFYVKRSRIQFMNNYSCFTQIFKKPTKIYAKSRFIW